MSIEGPSPEPTCSRNGSATNGPSKKSPEDFVFGKIIGEGSFSTVYVAKEVANGREFAIKVCEKRLIKKEKKVAYVTREKEVMRILNENPHPFFVRLYCTCQDVERLYFVMTLAKKGEILDYLRKLGCFNDTVSRFYAAEITLALEHLHKLGIVHRDLKPENILLSDDMHIKVSDFGSAKILNAVEDRPTPLMPLPRRNSFVGTAQYVSPEVLSSKPVTPSCDWWALGCIIYQMLSGLPPFRAPNEYLIFQKISKLDYAFPDGFDPVAKTLVELMLVIDPAKRLGSEELGGAAPIKSHPFFHGTDWDNLPDTTPPDMLPYLPQTADNPEMYSDFTWEDCGDWLLFQFPDNCEPGLNGNQLPRIWQLDLGGSSDNNGGGKEKLESPKSKPNLLFGLDEQQRVKQLAEQERTNPYHRFVENHLILKMGLIDKRKGLFARTRMFLLTEGPHLYYVDPANMEFKGEVPWSADMRMEAKNFKTFFVHTPNRTYYLMDHTGHAPDWCQTMEEVRHFYFD